MFIRIVYSNSETEYTRVCVCLCVEICVRPVSHPIVGVHLKLVSPRASSPKCSATAHVCSVVSASVSVSVIVCASVSVHSCLFVSLLVFLNCCSLYTCLLEFVCLVMFVCLLVFVSLL